MEVYVRLFYNNIENFCSQSFPRAKSILSATDWHALIRDFVHRHQSESPYFCEIQDEFLAYLVNEREPGNEPVFFTELCHYEWHRLHLLLASNDIESKVIDKWTENLEVIKSPLVFVLQYQWPVHEIDDSYTVKEIPDKPTQLIAYRDRNHDVRHLAVNELTASLVETFSTPLTVDGGIAEFLSASQESTPDTVADRFRIQALELLKDLMNRDILIAAKST